MQLLGGHLLEVGEVEAQRLGVDIGALLLHVAAQHLAQGIVEDVGGCVVASSGTAGLDVDGGMQGLGHVGGQALHDVHWQVVFTLGVDHLDLLVAASEHTRVAHLAAHLGIEWRAREHQLVEGVLLLRHLAVAQYLGVALVEVVAHKLGVALTQLHPVVGLNPGSVAGTLLLLGHLGVELVLAHCEPVFFQDELGEVEGEAIGVVEGEGLGAVDVRLASLLGLGHDTLDHLHACGQGAQEGVFLLLDHVLDEQRLCLQLGIGLAHRLDERVDEAVHEGLAQAQEGVAVAHGAAQDAAYHVASLGVAGQLPVGNAESHGAHVVGHHTHGHIHIVALAIVLARDFAYLLDEGLEYVGVVVGVLALQHAHKALKAHARVDDVHREGLEAAVGLAVELHEHDVPYLDHLWVVFVDQLAAGHLSLLLGRARVVVYLRARTAGTGVAHLPEVVVLVAVDDVVGRQVLGPVAGGLVVAGNALGGAPLKHGHIDVAGVELEHIDQILPGIVDGALLEIVAKAPVAQHLKHGVVVGVVSHLLQVVVLAAHAQALLRVGAAAWFGILGAQYDILPLVHACIGKHERGVVLDHQRCRRDDNVSFRLKEFLERVADFISSHHHIFFFAIYFCFFISLIVGCVAGNDYLYT